MPGGREGHRRSGIALAMDVKTFLRFIYFGRVFTFYILTFFLFSKRFFI